MLSAAIDHAVLVVQGTRRDDVVSVTLDGARTVNVTVNGAQSTFARRALGAIRIVLGRGDDIVTVGNPDRPISAGVVIVGGDGSDTLVGGVGDDTLRGESGDDELAGNGGNDLLQGGGGKDDLHGNGGDDLLLGDSGADDLRGDNFGGAAGNDTLCGGRGDDTLHEDRGTDRLCGNQGIDFFDFTDSPKDVRDETPDETVTQVIFGPGIRVISPPVLEPPVRLTPIDPITTTPTPIVVSSPPILVDPITPIVIGGGGSIISPTPIGTGTGAGTGGPGGVTVIGGDGGLILTGITGGFNPSGPITLGPLTVALDSLIFTFRDGAQGIVTHTGSSLLSTIDGQPVTPASLPLLLSRLGDASLDGGGSYFGPGSTLTVPAGTVIRLGDDCVQATAAGSSELLAGPLTLTFPSGNSLRIDDAVSFTIESPTDAAFPITGDDPTPPPTDSPGDQGTDMPPAPSFDDGGVDQPIDV